MANDSTVGKDGEATTNGDGLPAGYARLRTPSPGLDLDDSVSEAEALQLKAEGNELFRRGEYTAAGDKYQAALRSAALSDDERAACLANRAAVGLKIGNHDAVVEDATGALRLRPGYTKALGRRKQALEKLGRWAEAYEDALVLGVDEPERTRLKHLAKVDTERQRQEAISSLKQVGNSILSNFGLSLDDFQVQQQQQGDDDGSGTGSGSGSSSGSGTGGKGSSYSIKLKK